MPILGMGSAISNFDISKAERTIFFKLAQFQGPIVDPIPNMGSMGHFQVSSTYSQRVLKLMKFGSNLGLVRTLKLGKFKENRSLSFRDIEVRNSRPHTQNGQYGPFSS